MGHALSALTAYDIALRENGRFLLRIEDIDPERCRPEYETAIYEDLSWLGLVWEQPVRRQSEHMADYEKELDRLKGLGVVYPCFCSRKDIAEAIKAAGLKGAVHKHGPDGPRYPGTCRKLPPSVFQARLDAGDAPCWRLDSEKALFLTGPLSWHDREQGTMAVTPDRFDDVMIARKDVPTSYHLSVTVDDHLQEINLVTRGMDLFESTNIHRILQALLGYATPEYFHHTLLLDPETGEKLSKQFRSKGIRDFRKAGMTVDDVREYVCFDQQLSPFTSLS